MPFFNEVPAFEIILIPMVSKQKSFPEFNIEHSHLHPIYVSILYFDKEAHLGKIGAGGFSYFCITYSNL
jgi:hypothetical protein